MPARACCCPAKPRFKVTMPAAGGRAQPADLWLCGHHYRASRVTLVLANAQVEEHKVPALLLPPRSAASAPAARISGTPLRACSRTA